MASVGKRLMKISPSSQNAILPPPKRAQPPQTVFPPIAKNHISSVQQNIIPTSIIYKRKEVLQKNHYFDNEEVERLLYLYLESACTDWRLRDQIMGHTEELIRQIIKAHNLSQIYPGREESSIGDLFQTAWCVTPDTLVMSEEGMQKIGDVISQMQNGHNKSLYGLDGLKPIKNYIVKSESDTLKFRTKFGYELECTPDHPLYISGNVGPEWRNASDIKLGDLVGIVKEYIVHNNITWLPIESIIKSKSITCDVEIPDGHSFISNGFISHNCQLESALYKFECRPHCAVCYNPLRPNDSLIIDEFIFANEVITKFKKCPKCKVKLARENLYYKGKSKIFNLMSQVSRTVILAFIKKENRDKKNGPVFQSHLENRIVTRAYAIERFLNEAKEICKFNDDHTKLLECIKDLYAKDDKPHEGLISKLVDMSNLPRTTVTGFLRMLRLRSGEFTDSPLNDGDLEKRPKKDVKDSDIE